MPDLTTAVDQVQARKAAAGMNDTQVGDAERVTGALLVGTGVTRADAERLAQLYGTTALHALAATGDVFTSEEAGIMLTPRGAEVLLGMQQSAVVEGLVTGILLERARHEAAARA